MRWAFVFLLGSVGCSIEERSDYLVGRRCDPKDESTCDPEQKCLPHDFVERATDFRCRDAASFTSTTLVPDPPLAFCEDGVYECPEGIVCRADRIRPRDGAIRRLVCQEPGSPFLPPDLDGGL